jgi:hypothetical protein
MLHTAQHETLDGKHSTLYLARSAKEGGSHPRLDRETSVLDIGQCSTVFDSVRQTHANVTKINKIGIRSRLTDILYVAA